MDWLLIVLRIVHVGSAMAWFGGAFIGSFFLFPAAQALGPAGQPFMDYLTKRRRMGVYFPIVATLAIVSGATLYWRDSSGLASAWISSPSGLAFAIGGLAAIVAFVGLLKSTKRVSFASGTVSPNLVMAMLPELDPAPIVSVPLRDV